MNFSLSTAAKLVIPPVVPMFVRWCKAFQNRGRLFNGEDDLFFEFASNATAYAEYGCGASTIWIGENTNLPLITVDTSGAWIGHVKSRIKRIEGVNCLYFNMGAIGDWGRPLGYQVRQNFINYVEGPWTHGQLSDFVLIDGRFRVACFLTTLLRANAGTIILFDDYIGRPHFHLVEEFVPIFKVNSRQAAFIVPAKIDRNLIEAQRDKFLFVME